MYKPEYLEAWTWSDGYDGADWTGYYRAGVGRHRDSGALDRSNFEVALDRLEPLGAEEVVGGVSWIAIHADNEPALREADRIQRELENYPVLCEEHFSAVETAEANQVWHDCFRPKDRVEWLRWHGHECVSFGDLLSAVRGNFFPGNPGDLL